ncbi:hypothetical protein EHM69_04280 [candidate division KSB1 bacterium]|nr:MAG: hypothetical protein EHM69_04280 [candidate division KSB1 bacterium]
MLNTTLSYLFARAPISTMGFSGVTQTASLYLNGPGGQAGDGFPLPRNGFLTGLRIWDGTTTRTDTDEIAVLAGDRIAVFCQNVGPSFTVRVRVNGTSTSLQVMAVPLNSTLFVTVEFILLRD